MNLRDGYQEVMAAVALAWTLPPELTVSQWADENRVLPPDSAEPGQWRTSRNPLLREPMDALSEHHPCSQVSTMACSQDGKSEILNNWAGYTIAHAPASMLMVQPDEKAAERYSKKRIAPMIEASAALKGRIYDDAILDKYFVGGFLMMTGAGSPSALASTPIKNLGLDEIDKFPVSIKGQGSATKQAEQRLVTFARSKQYNSSTPIKLPIDDEEAAGGSEIWRKYQSGSRGRYFVPCPHCGHLQELLFKHLRWQKTIDEKGRKKHLTETAVYMCQSEGCGEAIEEHHKPDMLADIPMGGRARWVHDRPWVTEHLSYHWNALYTPIGLGRSWKEIADEWIQACRDRSKLVTFWNLILGLPFDDHADRLSESDIEDQAESYPLRQVPRGYFLLTGAVDTQKDHLDFLVRAWGRNERNIVIDRVKIWKDPEGDEAWAELTKLRNQAFQNTHGISLRIGMTAIDTGGSSTARVYRYCREMAFDSVIAIKGHSLRKQLPLSKGVRKDAKNSKGETARRGLALWMVGTDTIKQALFQRLQDWTDDACVADPTRRMVRLSKQLGHEFFRELTAEYFNEQTGLWDKIRERNEALDLLVYSHAAACHPSMRVDKLAPHDWDMLEQFLEPRNGDLFTAPQRTPESESVHTYSQPEPVTAQTAQADAQAPAPQPTPAPVPVPAPPAPAPAAPSPPADDWLGDMDHWLD